MPLQDPPPTIHNIIQIHKLLRLLSFLKLIKLLLNSQEQDRMLYLECRSNQIVSCFLSNTYSVTHGLPLLIASSIKNIASPPHY